MGIEAIDRLDEAQRGDLQQIVERLAGALVAARELSRQREEALHELVASAGVRVAVIADEQLAILARALRTRTARAGRRVRAHDHDRWPDPRNDI